MKKILFVMVLIFCLLGTTGTAYSYYEDSQISVLNENGEMYKITKTTSTNEKNLIPMGSILGMNDTYSLVYNYEVYVEKGMEIQSEIEDLVLEDSNLTEEQLSEVFSFTMEVEHIKDVELSNGLFSESTEGELLHIRIEVTMNSLEDTLLSSADFNNELSFTYLLTVSKKI